MNRCELEEKHREVEDTVMNDNITARIKCPFYVAHNRGTGNSITITCENIKTNMGLNINNLITFENEKQRMDNLELFIMYMSMCDH